MHNLLHALFCHSIPFYWFRIYQYILLQDSPEAKLRLDHARNPAGSHGVECEPECYTKLNTVSWLNCCKEAVISMIRDDFKLQNDNIFILFQNHCQFIKLRSTACHFWFPACRSLSDLCDRAISLTGMPLSSSPCFTSPKQRVQSSCVHDIQPLSLCCASAAPRTSLSFRTALLMQQLFQNPVSWVDSSNLVTVPFHFHFWPWKIDLITIL